MSEATFAMDEDALVVPEAAEFVGLELVLFGFGVVHVALAGAVAPGTLDDPFLAQEIGGLDGITLVR